MRTLFLLFGGTIETNCSSSFVSLRIRARAFLLAPLSASHLGVTIYWCLRGSSFLSLFRSLGCLLSSPSTTREGAHLLGNLLGGNTNKWFVGWSRSAKAKILVDPFTQRSTSDINVFCFALFFRMELFSWLFLRCCFDFALFTLYHILYSITAKRREKKKINI